jgi:hypothetical protein
MKKKIGVLGLMLTAAGLLFQPAIAAADDFGRAANVRVEQRHDEHVVTRYRKPVRRDVREHARREVVMKRDMDRNWR